MSQLLKLCIGLSLFLCVIGKKYHHCGRVGQDCMDGGTCNRTDGACSCLKDRVGPKCEFFFDDDVIANCTLPCLNGGKCYTSDVTRKTECVCLDDRFYGVQCEKERVSTRCEGETMHITVVPYPNFSGLVLIPQNRSHGVCDFNRTMSGIEAVHTLSVNVTNNECSVNELKDTPSADFTTYSVDVLIQSSGIFKTTHDMTVACKCVHSTKDVVPLDNTGPGLNNVLDPETVIEDQTKTVYEPISFQIQSADGSPVTKKPVIGDPLRIYMPLADTEKYINLTLVKCVVKGGNRAPINVIENGCINDIGKGIFFGDIQYNDSVPAVFVNFNAFRFPDNATTSFSCNVKLCNATEVCDRPSACPNGRQKRSTGIETLSEGVAVGTTLTVADPHSELEETALKEPRGLSNVASTVEEQKEGNICAHSGQVITILIVLVVIVVFLMVAALGLAVKFISSRSKF